MSSAGATVQQKTAEGFLKQLESDTLDILMGVEQKGQQTQEFGDQMDKMEKGIEDAMVQKDERLKQARMKIIEANAAKLHQVVAQEEQDLAMAMVGLKELMERIGLDYTELTQPSENEKGIVTSAEALVRRAELDLMQAGQAWFFKTKKSAIAQNALTSAKSNLELAKAKAQQLARQRLMNATLDKSLQHFITQVGRVVDIMTRRQQAIESQLNSVSKRRQQALQMKQTAAQKLQDLDNSLSEMEQKLQLAEQELNNFTNGSPEYVAKEAEVTNLRNQVEGVRGDRNTALAVYNSKERFAQELQIHETAQRKLRDNQRIWIAVLKSDTQERLVTFQSRLEAMKGMSDQQVAQGMDKIGTEIDGRNAEMLAQIGATSDKVRMEMFEAQPERMRRILNATGAQSEAIAAIRERENEAMKRFKDRYGIDPTGESFFSYEGRGSAA